MIPRECKRLAEVDFPIAMVSRHALAEKARRFGTPNQLHLWWAVRPLASSRALLLALLLPDPCDPHCPMDFTVKAKKLLPQVGCGHGETNAKVREGLLKFIGDFANWDYAAHATYIDVARGLVRAAHPGETPLVVDPFAGGGSIPLEAMRLGCDAFASDLNPVACLIQRAKLADIPRVGPTISDDVRKAGEEIKVRAHKELAQYFPKDPDGAGPIAYLWTRTVRCEAPDCGAEIPLVRSFWLSKKANRRRALVARVVKPRHATPHVEFEIFEPKSESDVAKGTVTRAKATCLCCGRTLAPERVRAQLAAKRGGADTEFDAKGLRTGGAKLLAVVTLKEGEIGRQYRLPHARDYEAVWKAQTRLEKIAATPLASGLPAVPNEPLPPIGTLGFRVQRYGMACWGDLFTSRQKVVFHVLASAIAAASADRKEVAALLAMVCTKLTDRCNALVNWSVGVECPNQLFKGTAVPMGWDFAESNILSESSASWAQSLDNVATNASAGFVPMMPSSPMLADARHSPLPDAAAAVWFTDPPYYDAVPYSDLSDFFLVWLKRALPGEQLLQDPFDARNSLSPKDAEVVEDATRSVNGVAKDKVFFERAMAEAFAEGCRVLVDDGIASVVFAHKTTEGWEALLSGMIRGGWVVTGSWPIATERAARVRARESAALATSVHLVCRPRVDHSVGDWAEVLRELPKRVADWMQRLQSEHVRGADLVFACIGPALEIFSRYGKVETADGREVPLAEYLEKVWEVVGRVALEQVLGGGTGALEEDARLTALFLWTLQSSNGVSVEADDEGEEEADDDDEDDAPRKKKTSGYSLVFDVARRFAQPLGIHLPEWEGRIIETDKGVVRLLAVIERATQLFGEDGTRTVAAAFERNPVTAPQMVLFPDDEAAAPKVKGRSARKVDGTSVASTARPAAARIEATTLDRVHAAMLLQRGGQASALRALLSAEQDRGPDFLRLANALSALYPRESEEKRLLDAMLLAVPR